MKDLYKISRNFKKLLQRIVDWGMGGGLMQEDTCAEGDRDVTPGIGEAIRRAGAESCVLLKNTGVLPLEREESVAVFGRCQLDWFFVGYGSGGDVHPPYKVNLIDGLKNTGAFFDEDLSKVYRSWTGEGQNAADQGWWGHWPRCHKEMPLDDDTVRRAAAKSKTAIVVIGRAAGENMDNVLKKGGYYLTDSEREMLDIVTCHFENTVVLLNIGNIIDMSWMEKYGDKISAAMIVWMGGMESGNSVCDALYGEVTPCGKLPDTIARRYEDNPSSGSFGGNSYNEYSEGVFVGYRYFESKAPDRVLYPFGYGLSYTSFEISPVGFKYDGDVAVTVDVSNVGTFPGKETLMLWTVLPGGRLEKPSRVLASFEKTSLLPPGGRERVTLRCSPKDIASYDQERCAFLLESGNYAFQVNEKAVGSLSLEQDMVIEQCEPLCETSGQLRERILKRMPQPFPRARGREASFSDVLAGAADVKDFVSQLGLRELEALTRGHGMMGSDLGPSGNAGVFGGVTKELREKGVMPISCCDGPAGIRLRRYCSLLPSGTALGATWDKQLVEELYSFVGREMAAHGVDILLSPGMNIHRDPLCGRNFEYFSEDPILSGQMAAAVVRGVQSQGRGCCPKHFACNNQEKNRNKNDSRVSERVLREIYLKGFEICVKESDPVCVMTAYNKVNGVWCHYNYDLVTTVLRGEWGFCGAVITDWWMQRSRSPEFPRMRDNAYRVRAQVDVLMPGDMGHLARDYRSDGTLLRRFGKDSGITLGELHRSAENVLRTIIRLKRDKNDC